MANRRQRRNPSASQQPENDNNNPPVTAGSSSTRHPVYHGIRLRAGKWAAAAHDVAALALKGTYAVLNFPDSILSNTLPECPTADDIRAAAARAAAAWDPTNQSGYGNSSEIETNPHGQYMDHEDVFGMPNLLADMAEGMLLSPPRINSSPPDDGTYYNYYSGGDNLWNY
ncbi:hypothetical protein Tco_1034081 [Tanacetum coccineum]